MTAPCPIYGFFARFQLVSALSETQETALTDDFLSLARARGLTSSGGFSGDRWSQVIRSEAGQATDADRVAIEEWAATRTEIATSSIGPLVDLENAS